MKVAFVVSGEGRLMQSVINAVDAQIIDAQIACVISDRECGAIERAKKHNIPATVFNKEEMSNEDLQTKMLHTLQEHKPDLICLAFDRMLSEEIVNAYPNAIINIHSSLLPSFKGFHAVDKAIAAGVKYAGFTIHYVDALMDNGPIICQYVTPISPDATAENLGKEMFEPQAQMFLQVIGWHLAGRIRIEGTKTIVSDAGYSAYPFCPSLDLFEKHGGYAQVREKLLIHI